MKNWLSMLVSFGIVTSTISPIVSCIKTKIVDEPINTDIFKIL